MVGGTIPGGAGAAGATPPAAAKNEGGLHLLAEFATLQAHVNFTHMTKREDLISLGYVLLVFFGGELPWTVPGAGTKDPKLVGGTLPGGFLRTSSGSLRGGKLVVHHQPEGRFSRRGSTPRLDAAALDRLPRIALRPGTADSINTTTSTTGPIDSHHSSLTHWRRAHAWRDRTSPTTRISSTKEYLGALENVKKNFEGFVSELCAASLIPVCSEKLEETMERYFRYVVQGLVPRDFSDRESGSGTSTIFSGEDRSPSSQGRGGESSSFTTSSAPASARITGTDFQQTSAQDLHDKRLWKRVLPLCDGEKPFGRAGEEAHFRSGVVVRYDYAVLEEIFGELAEDVGAGWVGLGPRGTGVYCWDWDEDEGGKVQKCKKWTGGAAGGAPRQPAAPEEDSSPGLPGWIQDCYRRRQL